MKNQGKIQIPFQFYFYLKLAKKNIERCELIVLKNMFNVLKMSQIVG